MPGVKIDWNLIVAVENGPRMSLSKPALEVTGYDYVRAPLRGTATGTTPAEIAVDVQPTSTATGSAAKVIFIAIGCSKYGPVSYATTAAGGSPTPVKHKLDGPHVFVGEGAVGFLGTAVPSKLYFENTAAEEITVEIIVGRSAV